MPVAAAEDGGCCNGGRESALMVSYGRTTEIEKNKVVKLCVLKIIYLSLNN